MQESRTLSAKHRRAVTALLTEPDTSAAAKAAGVSRDTRYRWLAEPAFQAAQPQSSLLGGAVKLIDPQLRDVLRQESVGILTWVVAGAHDYLAHGLAEPEHVRRAVAAYREENDSLALWIDDRCVLAADRVTTVADLRRDYHRFCSETGLHALSDRRFSMALAARRLEQTRVSHGVRAWRGIGCIT